MVFALRLIAIATASNKVRDLRDIPGWLLNTDYRTKVIPFRVASFLGPPDTGAL